MRLPIRLLLLCLLPLACGGRESGTATRDVDDFGAPVPAGSASAPARIVSLNPTTTEVLFTIGAGSRVVGRTHWDVWPDSARLVPDLGPGLRPNIEAVLATRPDLVVLYASNDNRAAAARLRAAGVGVMALKIDTIGDFRRAVRLLGVATGERRRAQETVDSVMRTLERVRAATAGLPRPKVFWHVWDAPLITIGHDSYMNELVETAGARNVYGTVPGPSPQIALEDLVRRDPDVILTGAEGQNVITHNAAWRAVRAVREGRIVVLDTGLVGRPSVRLGEAAVSLARTLHPGALP